MRVTKPDIYLIGSLRNPAVPELGREIRELGFHVFDDWFAAGERADDSWQAYEQSRGHRMDEALNNYAACHTFAFDKFHIDRADAVVLLMPAGKSGHLELGYALGKGKLGFILFDKEPERFDVMYKFASAVFFEKDRLFQALTTLLKQ